MLIILVDCYFICFNHVEAHPANISSRTSTSPLPLYSRPENEPKQKTAPLLAINFLNRFQFEPPQECLYLFTRFSIAFALSDRLRPILSRRSPSDTPLLFLPLFHLPPPKWAIHLFSTQAFTLGPLGGRSTGWILSFKKAAGGCYRRVGRSFDVWNFKVVIDILEMGAADGDLRWNKIASERRGTELGTSGKLKSHLWNARERKNSYLYERVKYEKLFLFLFVLCQP